MPQPLFVDPVDRYDHTMVRVLSGIQPSGTPHLGNLLGAIRYWVEAQRVDDALYCVVDLHALTLEIAPATLRQNTWEGAASLLAAGLDPDECTLFVQSHVPEHTELSWLLECTASLGELRRMTQFKEKGDGQDSVRVGLLTYPVLMAADILAYDAERVPVGDDQRQHLELARDLAGRFNGRYGETFVVPEATIPPVGARIMDLQVPTKKMSKSSSTEAGLILLTDPPEAVEKKIRRAVTDTVEGVAYDPVERPGVANLLEIFSAIQGRPPAVIAAEYGSYGVLKRELAEAVVELLRPIQERYAAITADATVVDEALRVGAAKAGAIASKTLARARDAIGLLPRPS
jgi:tryptophanyl-tRNA synthetase